MIVGVTADVIASFDNKAALAKLTGKPFGKHRTGEACTDNEKIKHSKSREQRSGIGGNSWEISRSAASADV